MDINTFAGKDDLYANVAERFCQCVVDSVASRGRFCVSLSGGSTPKRLYEILATRDLPWDAMHFYWGDERDVPCDHADSNFRMVREAMLGPAGVPTANIHRVPVELADPATSAMQYDETLRDHFDGPWPNWDLALLGMGDDAHTASLFPDTPATARSAEGKDQRWFVENFVQKFDAYRYTMTAAAINSARHKWFLVSGENKQTALQKVWADQGSSVAYPSRLINKPTWLVTADAMPSGSV